MRGSLIRFIKFPRLQVLFVHLFCWSLFIGYELSILYYSHIKFETPFNYICFYLINMLYFYGVVNLLGSTFNQPKPGYITGLFRLVLLMASYLIVKLLVDYLIYPNHVFSNLWTFIRPSLPAIVFRYSYFTLLAIFYWGGGYISYFRRQVAEAERMQLVSAKEKAEIKNAYLQQQISPHMLFNALNFIYSEVYKHSANAARSVLLLSDIVRFGLDGGGEDGKTSVSKEIIHIEQLIEINRFRFDRDLHLNFTKDGDFKGDYRIIPLILLTLTENIFKHGNFTDEKNPAIIKIEITNAGLLTIYTRNLRKPKNVFRQSSRLGIQNIRSRMDYSYPAKYTMLIAENDQMYELTLTVQL